MFSNWNDLEEVVKSLARKDDAERTPLSGATKHEEDVVGLSLVCQCKHTEDKNFSILEKDMKRLLDAARMLEKFPLFFSASKAGFIMSIPITEETEDTVDTVMDVLMLNTRLTYLYKYCRDINSAKGLKQADKERRILKEMAQELFDQNKRILDRIKGILKSKEDDLTMYNLFEGQPNEPEKR